MVHTHPSSLYTSSIFKRAHGKMLPFQELLQCVCQHRGDGALPSIQEVLAAAQQGVQPHDHLLELHPPTLQVLPHEDVTLWIPMISWFLLTCFFLLHQPEPLDPVK